MSHWEKKKIGDFLTLEYGKPLDESLRKKEGIYPAYGANGVKAWSDKYYFDQQTIIIGRKGSAGELTLTEQKFWPLDVTYYVKFDVKKYDLIFIYHLLSLLDLPSLATGVKPGINRNNVYAIEVKVPPIKEQQQIVKILDQVFADIEKARANAEKNMNNVREIFESYLNQIFIRRNVNWVTSVLKNISYKIGSGATPKGGKSAYKEHGISLIRSMNVHDRQFIEKNLAFISDVQASKLNNVTLQEGDVLINITGASVARSCVVPNAVLPARVNQHVMILRVDDRVVLPEFLNYALTSKKYKDILLAVGEAGSTRQAVTKAQLENFELCYPTNTEEQKELLIRLHQIEKKTRDLIHIYNKKITVLDELKKSILQKAFNGELTKALDYEVASC